MTHHSVLKASGSLPNPELFDSNAYLSSNPIKIDIKSYIYTGNLCNSNLLLNSKKLTAICAGKQCCGSGSKGQKDSESRIRIRITEFKHFNPKKFSKLSEIWSGMFIPRSRSRIRILDFLPIPDPGSRVKATEFHCYYFLNRQSKDSDLSAIIADPDPGSESSEPENMPDHITHIWQRVW